MNTSVILDVSIGLIIIYISAALIVSAIQEIIASLLQWRSQHLEESILQLMLGQDIQDFQKTKDFRDQIYNNPLIQSMNHTGVSFWSRFTANLVFNWQKHKNKDKDNNQHGEAAEKNAEQKLYSTSSPSYIDSKTFAIALINELQKGTSPFGKIQELITILESPETQSKIPKSLLDTLLILANNAKIKIKNGENELLSFQKEIEIWFDSSMDRAAGVYKRNAQLVCFILGLFITLLLNLDTLYISQTLLNDSTLRTTLANNAGELFYNSSTDANGQLDIEKLEANFPKIFDNHLPIAPFYENVANFMDCQNQNYCPINKGQFNLGKFSSAVCGWMITTLAVFMGAPFWFDLLSKLVNVRATGNKPDNS
ncbi:hypothetical protein [Anabaena azotica]|uniref:hypothetical protein n=1 Tax=Anabaena azotica TaxID=197653 RepID=UPI0039A41680